MNHDSTQRWRRVVDEIRAGRSKGREAPHKLLLVLLILRHAADGGDNGIPYSLVEATLGKWFRELLGRRAEPYLPFWHLQTDGFWSIEDVDSLERREGKDRATKRALRQRNPRGFVDAGLWQALATDPKLAPALANYVIETRFDDSDRQRIRAVTGFGARST